MKKLVYDIADLIFGMAFIVAGFFTHNLYYIGIGAIMISLVTNTGGYKE